jgi:hypothetical protein
MFIASCVVLTPDGRLRFSGSPNPAPQINQDAPGETRGDLLLDRVTEVYGALGPPTRLACPPFKEGVKRVSREGVGAQRPTRLQSSRMREPEVVVLGDEVPSGGCLISLPYFLLRGRRLG